MTNISHFVRACAATGAILATESLPNPSVGWPELIERLGLAVALVIFFVVTGWRRERRMSERISRLERDLAKLAGDNAKLTQQVIASLERENQVTADAMRVLDSRTCFAFSTREEFEQAKRMIGTNGK